jgi:hypothetical protein
MATTQIKEILKDVVASIPEFLGSLRKVPDLKKSLVAKKPMSITDVLVLNHAMVWVLIACAVVTEGINGVIAILSGGVPAIVSACANLLMTAIASTFQAYQIWLIGDRKKGDGYPGPLVIFGSWWLFLIGLSLCLQCLFLLFSIVTGVMSLLGVPSLETVATIWSIVVSAITFLGFGFMGHGLMHNNKAYPISKLPMPAAKSEASRGREMETTGAKNRSSTPTPGSKRDSTPSTTASTDTDTDKKD